MLLHSFCPLLTMKPVGLTPIKRPRGSFYIRLLVDNHLLQHFQSYDGGNQGGDEEQSPKGSRLVKEKDAYQHRADCPYTRPHGISRADRKRLCSLCQQPHARHGKGQKSTHPLPIEQPCSSRCLSQTKSEAYFTQSCNDKNNPIHNFSISSDY